MIIVDYGEEEEEEDAFIWLGQLLQLQKLISLEALIYIQMLKVHKTIPT